MMNRKFTRREKVYIVILSILLVVCAYYYLVHAPTVEGIADAQSRMQAVEDQTLIEQTRAQIKSSMEEDLAQLESRPDRAHTEIPYYDNSERLATALSVALSESETYNIDFRKPELNQDNMMQRQVNIRFEAMDYEAAREIVTAIYEIPYRNQVTAMELSPIETPEEQVPNLRAPGMLSVSVTIIFFEIAAE